MAFVTDDTAMLYFLGTTGEETAGAFELESGLLLEDASATVGFGITVEGSLTTPGCTFLNGVDSFDASPELTETEERALPTFETTFLKLEELELAEEIENLFEMVSLCKELIENLFVFTELPLSSLKLSIDHLLLWLLWTLDLFFFDKFDEEVLGSEGLLDSITDCLFSCAVTLEFGTLFNSCRIDLRLRSPVPFDGVFDDVFDNVFESGLGIVSWEAKEEDDKGLTEEPAGFDTVWCVTSCCCLAAGQTQYKFSSSDS